MYKNLLFIPFIFMLILGTLLAVSSSSWFPAWLGLEINLLSIIPLIFYNSKNQINEAAVKYFIIQALASSIIILSIVNLPHLTNFNLNLNVVTISLALSIKMALAPFHLWIPQLIESFSWLQALLILTWQKIAPIILISSTSPNSLAMLLIISSALLGSVGGFMMFSPKKIMAFSSINHSGWMLYSLLISWNLWFFYFLIYCFISLSLMLAFAQKNITNINQINTSPKTPLLKFYFSLNLLSLAGLPPLLGFLPKLLLIFNLLKTLYSLTLLIFLMVSSLLSLYFYMKLIISMNMNPPLNFTNKPMLAPFNFFLFLNLFINLLIPPICLLLF
uniref:NADH-ubiquinone oxidoreductase chain 2 n=1 Tax=Megalothorax incertus TaxID=2579793 RepID=A0A8E8GVB2_9HEXA|nr:NADH dehydrogenase subunit 2 [Megalothorax incertus]